VTGAYAQYTYNLNEQFVAMAGLRADHSTRFGTFVTPRAHIKWSPSRVFTLRASAGRGYRTVHPFAEFNYLISSGRKLVVDDIEQEAAWNMGTSMAFNFKLFGKKTSVNAEYYYTTFDRQAVVDYDTDPTVIHITNLRGKSFSHTMQVDATCEVYDGLSITAAYRLNDVKSTYGGLLLEKPLTSRSKGLLTASYTTPLGLWQFDATLQINGGGRLPLADTPRYNTFAQLNCQITRWFKHFSIYVGGENLTNYRQKNPIIHAMHPWSDNFEPTLVWGPMHGVMAYVGFRYNLK
jgi:outer membrane receptor for ferrienterochelin and colicin